MVTLYATLTHFHFYFWNSHETSVLHPIAILGIFQSAVDRLSRGLKRCEDYCYRVFLLGFTYPAVVSVVVALTKNDKRLLYNYYYIVHATRIILLLKSITIISLISRQIVISSRRVSRPRPRRIAIIIKYYYLTSCSPFLTGHYVRLIDL